MESTVLNRQRTHRVPLRILSSFLERLTEEMAPRRADSVAVCLVSDRRMREFNRTFRGRDATTDVLSFPSGPPPAGEGERHLGDIVISVPAALRQAEEAGCSLVAELKLLTLHGYLHLLGYDHNTDDGTMMRLQRKLARSLVHDARGRAAR